MEENEENSNKNLNFPTIISNINEWAFKFKYDFFSYLEKFLLSGIITDYISIKLIKFNTLAIISTKPAVELNIINSPLFSYDKSYSLELFSSHQPFLWVDTFEAAKFYELKQKKMDTFGLTAGISFYVSDYEQKTSISFATNNVKQNINNYYLNNMQYLYKIANFVEKISYPMFCEIFSTNIKLFFSKQNISQSKMFLAVNNMVKI